MQEYKNADEAFRSLYKILETDGIEYRNTKMLDNIGFKILNPLDNIINTEFFKKSYADREFAWYMAGDPNVKEIAKIAPIWANHADFNGNVNSNYGYQWNRENQLDLAIAALKKDRNSRRAVITIYDGKEQVKYTYDTPCTLCVQFYVIKDRLNMTVVMRSNDLVLGFCYDQYAFSSLLEIVAKELNLSVGTYTHYVINLHLYSAHFGKVF